jgi:hypothetical protein
MDTSQAAQDQRFSNYAAVTSDRLAGITTKLDALESWIRNKGGDISRSSSK